MLRTLALVAVLAVAALVVPDSSVQYADVELVKLHTAGGRRRRRRTSIWILAVGSDARPGQDMTPHPRRRAPAGRHEHPTGAASAIGIPRDSWVGIPGHGSNQINAALYFGGPELLGRTVGNLVGVQPDYVFVTRFPFFEDMIDDIGGIDVAQPAPVQPTSTSSRRASRPARSTSARTTRMAFSRIRKNLLARRLRPLRQPAAGAARHPGQDPGPAPTRRASSRAAC